MTTDEKKKLIKKIAKISVDQIIADITDRSGLGNEWEELDEDIQEEIVKKWNDIIVKNIPLV